MGLQLTRGGEYAIRAMTYLCKTSGGRDLVAARGRRRAGHPRKLPRQDLPEPRARRPRRVATRRPRRLLAGPPGRRITVREVVEAIDGPIALNGCVLRPEDCRRSGDCRMHEVWVLAQERMMDVLGEVTLADLVARPHRLGAERGAYVRAGRARRCGGAGGSGRAPRNQSRGSAACGCGRCSRCEASLDPRPHLADALSLAARDVAAAPSVAGPRAAATNSGRLVTTPRRNRK